MSKTRQLAIGAVFSALGFILMYMSSFMPLTYLWVVLSGFMIMAIVTEAGRKAALCAYFAVSLLCIILLPNVMRVVEFAIFIGCYPVIKTWLDVIKHKSMRRMANGVIFIIFAVVSLFVSINVLGITIDFDEISQVGILVALPLGQMIFLGIFYDYALGRIHRYYLTELRQKIFHKKNGG